MRHRIGLAVALSVALASLAQGAAATSVTPISKIDWEQNQRLEFRWRTDAVPPAWMRAAVLDAATGSNQSRGARAAVLAHDSSGSSWVAYTTDIDHPNALAFASRRVPDLFKVWFRPHGYVFDWGTLRWCQFYDSAPRGCFDAEMVALHEFGHVQGLGHADADAAPLDTVMHSISAGKPAAGWNARAFGPCDVAALQIRYELLTAGTAVSSCLTLPTALTLEASSSVVPPGSSVTFTAKLKIADGAPYARLAGDPLSYRSVVLERRAVGATSWTAHAAMPAVGTPGTYRLSVGVSSTYEWRAVFRKPDEGVLGDASAMLKVTVTSGCSPYCI